MVVVTHCIQPVYQPPALLGFIASKGVYGVQLFFIVSSLTLFLSYEQRQKRDGAYTGVFFFIRRFFRIVPAFYLAIGFYSIALVFKHQILFGVWESLNVLNIAVYAMFLSLFYIPSMIYLPFGGWTVHVEMLFYLLIPWLFKRLYNLRRALIFFIVTLLFSQILDVLVRVRLPSYYEPYFWFPNQLPVFATGIITYWILKQYPLKTKVAGNKLFVLSIFWLVLVLWICRIYTVLPEYLLVSIGFSLLVLAMSTGNFYVLENPLTKFMGRISYSLYLWHFAIVEICWYFYKATSHFYGMRSLPAFILILAFTLSFGSVISWMSYHFIERKGMAWGKLLIQRWLKNYPV
jgi:peptidoglycan/LPS O-acetylase OafA/YrhL